MILFFRIKSLYLSIEQMEIEKKETNLNHSFNVMIRVNMHELWLRIGCLFPFNETKSRNRTNEILLYDHKKNR